MNKLLGTIAVSSCILAGGIFAYSIIDLNFNGSTSKIETATDRYERMSPAAKADYNKAANEAFDEFQKDEVERIYGKRPDRICQVSECGIGIIDKYPRKGEE